MGIIILRFTFPSNNKNRNSSASQVLRDVNRRLNNLGITIRAEMWISWTRNLIALLLCSVLHKDMFMVSFIWELLKSQELLHNNCYCALYWLVFVLSLQEQASGSEAIGQIYQDEKNMAAILMRRQLETGDLMMVSQILYI